jgi:hypothetical protein
MMTDLPFLMQHGSWDYSTACEQDVEDVEEFAEKCADGVTIMTAADVL